MVVGMSKANAAVARRPQERLTRFRRIVDDSDACRIEFISAIIATFVTNPFQAISGFETVTSRNAHDSALDDTRSNHVVSACFRNTGTNESDRRLKPLAVAIGDRL